LFLEIKSNLIGEFSIYFYVCIHIQNLIINLSSYFRTRQFLAPEIHILTPEIEFLAPETHILASEIRILTPEIDVLYPETRVLTSEIRFLVSETLFLSFETIFRKSTLKVQCNAQRKSKHICWLLYPKHDQNQQKSLLSNRTDTVNYPD